LLDNKFLYKVADSPQNITYTIFETYYIIHIIEGLSVAEEKKSNSVEKMIKKTSYKKTKRH